ncbi:MAG: Gfo/Idh/MocA family oxidoreductase, partial [Akkermansiaceae bacterium]|nr:Gfo/Idh/MocA family oxidoreductase [Verrucomicrobiales bacterium]
QLAAVCSPRPPKEPLPTGVAYFADTNDMLRSGTVDAVIIATPHPSHLALGEQVLRHGLHLMMEKPLTATKLDGEKLLAIPRRPDQVFAIMMNLRTHPHYRRIKQWIDDGTLGDLQRVQWTITNWFRPEAYFGLSSWRATWQGEGGGVLINQALHNLDVLQWLCGMPTSVRAHCKFGHEHNIEVEDHVVAVLNYASGATGLFTTSTGEAPGVNRLEIAGTRALVVLEKDVLRLTTNETDVREFSRTTENAFGAPPVTVQEFPLTEENPSHSGVLTNFVDAILDGAPLLANAAEGLKSVELANAMVYSQWQQASVALPLDAQAYQAALEHAITTSRPRHRVIKAAQVDMKKSYS